MSSCVLQIVQHMRPGGLENVALNLAAHSRYEHYIVSLDGTLSNATADWPRLRTIKPTPVFFDKPPGWSLKCIWQLRQLIKQLRPIAVHSHHIGPLVYSSLANFLAPSIRHIHSEHDAWHLHDEKARKLQQFMLKLSRPQHVAVGAHVSRSLNQYWPEADIHEISNAVDTEHFSPQDKSAAREALKLPQEAWIISCAARLETVKGVDVLVRAHAELPEHVHLAIGGTGSESDKLMALCAELKSSKRVHWLGHIDDTRLLYNAGDVYCQPSRNEGLPLAPIEAQACGIPCVLTNVGASAQISGWPGTWVVPPEDPQALADQLRLITDNALASPREEIRARFSMKQMADAYDKLYMGSLEGAA